MVDRARREHGDRLQHLVEAGRLPARDPLLDPPQDLPEEAAADAIPDVALPDHEDPHMVTPAFNTPLVPADAGEAVATVPEDRKH